MSVDPSAVGAAAGSLVPEPELVVTDAGLKQGVLGKLGKRWGVRRDVFVVVHRNDICIHETSHPASPIKKKLIMSTLSVVETSEEESKHQFAFKITESVMGHTFLFVCESRQELEGWISAIKCMITLPSLPESKVPISNAMQRTYNEFTAIVSCVDQMLPLICTDLTIEIPLTPFEKTPYERAKEVGAVGLGIATCAAAAAMRRPQSAVRVMSSNLIALLLAIHEMQNQLFRREGVKVGTIGKVTQSLFGLTSDMLLRFSEDCSLPQQVQHSAILTEKRVDEAVEAAKNGNAEGVDAAVEQIQKLTSGMVDNARKYGETADQEIPLFALPAVIVNSQEFCVACMDCSVLGLDAVQGYLEGPTVALKDAVAKLSTVCQTGNEKKSLNRALKDAEYYVDEAQSTEIEKIVSIGDSASEFISQLKELLVDVAGNDMDSLKTLTDHMLQTVAKMTTAVQTVSSDVTDAIQNENFQQESSAMLRNVKALAESLGVIVESRGKAQAESIKAACATIPLAESITSALRAAIVLQRYIKRSGTDFDGDTGFNDGDEDEFVAQLDDSFNTGGLNPMAVKQNSTDTEDLSEYGSPSPQVGTPNPMVSVPSMLGGGPLSSLSVPSMVGSPVSIILPKSLCKAPGLPHVNIPAPNSPVGRAPGLPPMGKAPGAPGGPPAGKAPGVPPVGKAPGTPGSPPVGRAPGLPPIGKAPGLPGESCDPTTPKTPGSPLGVPIGRAPGAPPVGKAPGLPPVGKAPGLPDESGESASPKTPGAPGIPVVRAAGLPPGKAPGAPGGPPTGKAPGAPGSALLPGETGHRRKVCVSGVLLKKITSDDKSRSMGSLPSPLISKDSSSTGESSGSQVSSGCHSPVTPDGNSDSQEVDVNIWKEPADNPSNIIIDPVTGVRAANLNKLVERLTMVGEQDMTFQKTFITTYRSFTTPDKLFDKLMQRYEMAVPHLPPSVSTAEYHKLFILPVQLRIINVLRQWMESSFFDFDDKLIERVRAFINEVSSNSISEKVATFGVQLSKILNSQVAAQENEKREQQDDQKSISSSEDTAAACLKEQEQKKEDDRRMSVARASPLDMLEQNAEESMYMQVKTHTSAEGFRVQPLTSMFPIDPADSDPELMPELISKLFYFSPMEIAEQITFFDFHYYRQIKPFELLNQRWNKHRELSPNVCLLIERFNEVSLWSSTMILSQKNAKSRAAMWQRLIAIAECLQRLNNFNSLMAMLASFNKSAVYRLHLTRDMLPVQAKHWFESAMNLMQTEGSYRNYREALRTARTPVLPYLGVYLTDLTFIEDGNKDMTEGLINFRKRQLIYGIIADIQMYQQTRYFINPNPIILAIIHSLPFKDEDALYHISLAREPRGSYALQQAGLATSS